MVMVCLIVLLPKVLSLIKELQLQVSEMFRTSVFCSFSFS